MKVTVKSVSIRPPAPPNQEREIELAAGASVADALLKFGLRQPDVHAALLNDKPIPAGERTSTFVNSGDVITVFPPIHGG